MPCVTTVETDGIQRNSLSAPGIITGLDYFYANAVGERNDAALVVGMGIIHLTPLIASFT